jgi:GntR family transcriptional regulator
MEFRQSQAIYQQIADYICEEVLTGRWQEGDRIPSVRELAETAEVNPNTVMRAFGYLQDMGVIHNQRGIGYFVADGAFEKTRELKRGQFLRRELPVLVKTMDLLDISFEELKTLYGKMKTGTLEDRS